MAMRAYGATRAAMDPRVQEADVFRRVTGSLRAAAGVAEDDMRRVRAIADNRRLWLAVESAAGHPGNALPERLRADLVSLGRAVRREMDLAAPDLGFLIDVNEQVAAGLGGAG
ncbi:flagellar biosynthesis regulator FlaF [Plastoroseomonas arctica]|nr:flagellar biosynthesis regulator FlaF [Plastoroseomonas arctica]